MDRTRRFAATAAAAALAVAAAAGFLGWSHRVRLVRMDGGAPVASDGRGHPIAKLYRHWPFALRTNDVRVQVRAGTISVDPLGPREIAVELRTPVLPGSVLVQLQAGGESFRMEEQIAASNGDRFGDGTPDYLRLHDPADQQAFRAWFTALAVGAADMPEARLPAEITDCSSLLRWAYREALVAHDDRWYAQFPPGEMPQLSSVVQWSYPNTPLRAELFRTAPGPFHPEDFVAGAFAQFADAKTLFRRNAYFVSRAVQRARPGDLLFFHQLEETSTYHSMIVTGEHGGWVVYHTGPIDGHRGEMRRVLLTDLLQHPDPRWHPSPSNANFLGVYRWNILREE